MATGSSRECFTGRRATKSDEEPTRGEDSADWSTHGDRLFTERMLPQATGDR